MKRLYNTILASVLLLAISACEENEIDRNAPVEDMAVRNTLTAFIENGDTRTTLNETSRGTYKPYWSEGDAIGVMIDGKETPSRYDLSEGAGTSQGTFTGFVKGSSYVAYYPYDNVLSLKEDNLSVFLPFEQRYVEDSFGADSYPMVAVSTTEELDFRNLCSVLRISITGTEMVESIIFKANDENVKVSGKAFIDTQYDKDPVLVMSEDALSQVSLICGGHTLNSSKATDFHIVVPAQTYKGGFTITVSTTSGVMTKTTESDIVMERSQLRAIPEFEFEKTSGVDPSTTLEGDGTEESPFLVSSLENLMLVQSRINMGDGTIKGVDVNKAHFLQTKDISLAAVCNPEIGSWVPIGKYDEDNRFEGVYDGGGYEITDLYINTPEEKYVGLFGKINYGGIVCNLEVSGSVTGRDYVGIVAGEVYRVEDVIASGQVEGSGKTGGIAGEIDWAISCINYADVTSGGYAGGISSVSSSAVSRCENYGSISGNSCVGGIIGYHNANMLYNSVNFGSVNGTTRVGGISGFSRQSGKLFNCLNVGEVYGVDTVGGVCGYCSNSSVIEGKPSTRMANCLNVGKVSSENPSTMGSVCGLNEAEVFNCYWIYDLETSAGLKTGVVNNGGIVADNVPLTEAQLKGEDMINPLYVSGEDSYYNVVDALNAWAADNDDPSDWNYVALNGWEYSGDYPVITENKAEKPSGGELESVFKLDPSEVEIHGLSNEFKVSVITNMNYSISSKPDWISEKSVEQTLTGFDHIFVAEANENSSSREGTIVFCNEDQNCFPVRVIQKEAPSEDDVWKYKDFWHRSMIMKFTGTWCGYCPMMDEALAIAERLDPDKFEAVCLHYSDEYQPDCATAFVNRFGIHNYPTGLQDFRVSIPNYTATSYTAELFKAVLDEQESCYPPVTGISFTSSLTGSTVTADVKIYAKKADDYRVTVLLLEDGIMGTQAGADGSYEHNHVVRLALSSPSGNDAKIDADESVWSKSFSGTVPYGCNTSNLRILVYVERPFGSQEKVQTVRDVDYGDFGDRYIDNCRSEKVGVEAVLQFADDPGLGGGKEESSDYSSDGKVTVLQKASKGNGIDIVLMGDAFNDKLIADGTYDKVMRTAYEKFFTEEPYKTYKDMFNVYSVTAVSKHSFYGGETAFEGYFGDGTLVGGNDNTAFTYAKKAISEDRIDESLIIVMMNSPKYAGTCYMYYPNDGDCGNGVSVSYFPIGTDDESLARLLHHEAGGHGFSKLSDEYAYESNGRIPANVLEDKRRMEAYGWGKNVDYTNDPSEVKWAHFLEDSRYADEGLGVFEGAATYWYGAYRPTDNSIMNNNYGGFNAPSRESIYYRIHKLAYGADWEYDYEEFVEYDAVNRSDAAGTISPADYVHKRYEPTAPPVIIRHSWREAGSLPEKAERRILREEAR